MKSTQDIINGIINKEYETPLPYPTSKKFSENHVFDENQSVKWNKEQVVIQNNKVKEEKDAYYKDRDLFYNRLRLDCIDYIIDYGFNAKQAELIYSRASDKCGSYQDMVYIIEDYCEFIYDVNKEK